MEFMQKTCQRSHRGCERIDCDFAQVVAKCKQAHDPNGPDFTYWKRGVAAGAATGLEPENRNNVVWRKRAAPQRHWRPD